jgi:DHA3 family macrolide efflux protein-like MFS transporter
MNAHEQDVSPEQTQMPGWKKRVAVFLVGQTITTFGSMLVQYAIWWHLTLTTPKFG